MSKTNLPSLLPEELGNDGLIDVSIDLEEYKDGDILVYDAKSKRLKPMSFEEYCENYPVIIGKGRLQ